MGSRLLAVRLAQARRYLACTDLPTLLKVVPDTLLRALGGLLVAQRDRWFLCTPIFLGIGIISYPLVPEGAVLFLLPCILLFFLFRRESLRVAGIALLCVVIGFLSVVVRVHVTGSHVLQKPLYGVWVEGRVEDIRARTTDHHLYLAPETVGLPKRLRVVLRSAHATPLVPGDRIRIRLVLFPPPGPAMPGAFNSARKFHLQGIGATGASLSLPKHLPSQDRWRFSEALTTLRMTLADRIARSISGDSGPLAAALITGRRDGVTQDVRTSLHHSGLAHILAISGLHMTLVAGTLFWLIRSLCALFPALVLRYPLKPIAAVLGFFGSLAYLGLSGASVATQRAFIMISIAFLAVLVGRPVLTMRNVALAAWCILLLRPESLFDVSFQMSFAATAALIAVYEILRDSSKYKRGMIRNTAKTLFVTSLTAGLATAPFIIHHFNRIALYGLFANIFGMPIFTFWVMPLLLLSSLLIPLGLEAVPLTMAGRGLDGIRMVARFFADVQPIPSLPSISLPLVVIGGLWFCLWKHKWRYLGLVLIAFALLFSLFFPAYKPDLLIARNGLNAAVHDSQGTLHLARYPASRYAASVWLQRSGDPRSPQQAHNQSRLEKKEGVYTLEGRPVFALVRTREELQHVCGHAPIIVTQVIAPCPEADLIITRKKLKEKGAHALWFTKDGLRIRVSQNSRRPLWLQ